mgnify:CR=1 FL=1
MSPTPAILPAFPKPTRTTKPRKHLRAGRGKRRQQLRAEDFGERAEAVRGMRCLARREWWEAPQKLCAGDIEAAHAKSRGAGGNRRHLVPLCQRHHREQHDRGVLTFQTTYRLDLRAEADRIAAELDARGLP